MINWEFDSNNVEDRSFKPLDVGDYRVRIEDVEERQGAKFPYYNITLKVSGDNRKLWHNLVFMTGKSAKGADLKKMTDQRLHELWTSFGIPVGELDYTNWIGKVGAARVKHDFYNGEERAVVAYFLDKEKQEKLPPWAEEPPMTIDDDFSLMEEDDEIPF